MKVKYREGLELSSVHGGMLTRPLKRVWSRLVKGEVVEMSSIDAKEPLKLKLIQRIKEKQDGN